jgi:AraC family transcriptional regulator of adaptative response/methylated-DNA-[protein]-cysteine methyltransferase
MSRIGNGAALAQAGTTRDEPHLAVVSRACRYIEARMGAGGPEDEVDVDSAADGPVTLSELGRHCGLSPWHLQRLFKRVMGVTPRQYGDAHRVARLRSGLQQGDGVAAATYDAGFGSSSRVYERADATLGMTPASYARGGEGAHIVYAIAGSPLGRLLVAATAKGICFVSLRDSDGELEAALREEFPAAAEIRRDDAELGAAVAKILRNISGREPHIDLPLDVRATAFQRRVWEELRRIPAGQTRSYAAIARQIGTPSAQRAVGRACATNPVAIVVPCHRILREDGALGGYRWGLERKRALLRQEAGADGERSQKE